MDTHQQLLHAITVAPNNVSLRFLFADWLEEHGNPLSHAWREGVTQIPLRLDYGDGRDGEDTSELGRNVCQYGTGGGNGYGTVYCLSVYGHSGNGQGYGKIAYGDGDGCGYGDWGDNMGGGDSDYC